MNVHQAKVCLLGDFAVGKTSLVRWFIEGRFDDRYLSTIGVKISRKSIERCSHVLSLILWDLAGGGSFTRYQPSYLRGASAGLIVCDLTRRDTLDSLPRYAEALREVNPQAAAVFIANKVDLVDQREISAEALEDQANALGGVPFLTSAKTGEGVEQAFIALAQAIEARHDLLPFP